MLLDSDYLLIGLPALALSAWAKWRVLSACRNAGSVLTASGMIGRDMARRLMDSAGMDSVEVETASGQLANHYDTSGRVLRLSAPVASGRSVAAVGMAAHEAAHAIQDRARYPGLLVRAVIVPLTNLCSTTFWLLVLAGLFLGMFRLIIWSVLVLWLSVILQLINLPVELDASRRARQAILAEGLVTSEEDRMLQPVLNATAWTHVAGVLWDVWPLRQLVAAARRPVSSA
jgi:uncharacterized protein